MRRGSCWIEVIVFLAWASIALGQPAPQAKAQAENAADNYLAASAMYKGIGEADEDAVKVMEKGWVGPHPEIEDALFQNSDAFTELREGIKKTYCAMPAVEGFDSPVPYLASMRSMTRLMLAEGRFYESKGEYEKGYQNFLGVAKMGQDVAKNGVLIHFLVSMALENMAFKVIAGSLKTPSAPAEVYEAAAKRLAALEGTETTLAQALRQEFDSYPRGIRRAVQQAYAKLGAQVVRETLSLPPYSLFWGAWTGMLRWIRECMNNNLFPNPVEIWLAYPPHVEAGLANIKRYGDAAVSRAERPYAEAVKIRLVLPNDPLCRTLLPALERVELLYTTARLRATATRTMVALVASKKRNGQYPASLDAAVKPAPMDPFSNKPLQYKAVGKGCMIWSVGPDLADDHADLECPERPDAATKGDIVYRLER